MGEEMNFAEYYYGLKSSISSEKILGKRVKLLHFLCGIKKNTIVKITGYSLTIEPDYFYICGRTSKKGFCFYPEEFEFLEMV